MLKSFIRLVTLSLGLISLQVHAAQKVSEITPCGTNQDRYFVSYQINRLMDKAPGIGNAFVCANSGAMETATGIKEVTNALSKGEKGSVVILYFTKLKN